MSDVDDDAATCRTYTPDVAVVGDDDETEFAPAAYYAGPRFNMVFGGGPRGTGYYRQNRVRGRTAMDPGRMSKGRDGKNTNDTSLFKMLRSSSFNRYQLWNMVRELASIRNIPIRRLEGDPTKADEAKHRLRAARGNGTFQSSQKVLFRKLPALGVRDRIHSTAPDAVVDFWEPGVIVRHRPCKTCALDTYDVMSGDVLGPGTECTLDCGRCHCDTTTLEKDMTRCIVCLRNDVHTLAPSDIRPRGHHHLCICSGVHGGGPTSTCSHCESERRLDVKAKSLLRTKIKQCVYHLNMRIEIVYRNNIKFRHGIRVSYNPVLPSPRVHTEKFDIGLPCLVKLPGTRTFVPTTITQKYYSDRKVVFEVDAKEGVTVGVDRLQRLPTKDALGDVRRPWKCTGDGGCNQLVEETICHHRTESRVCPRDHRTDYVLLADELIDAAVRKCFTDPMLGAHRGLRAVYDLLKYRYLGIPRARIRAALGRIDTFQRRHDVGRLIRAGGKNNNIDRAKASMDLLQIDITFPPQEYLRKKNEGVNNTGQYPYFGIVVAIDVFSRYAWCIPLRNYSGNKTGQRSLDIAGTKLHMNKKPPHNRMEAFNRFVKGGIGCGSLTGGGDVDDARFSAGGFAEGCGVLGVTSDECGLVKPMGVVQPRYQDRVNIQDAFHGIMHGQAPARGNTTRDNLALPRQTTLMSIFMAEGAPKEIQTDNGAEFSDDGPLGVLCRMFGVRKTLTKAYSPNSNAIVENFNHTLKKSLFEACSMPGYSLHDWPDLLPHVTFAYNNTIHSTTGMAPFRMHRGRDPGVGRMLEARTVIEAESAAVGGPAAERSFDLQWNPEKVGDVPAGGNDDGDDDDDDDGGNDGDDDDGNDGGNDGDDDGSVDDVAEALHNLDMGGAGDVDDGGDGGGFVNEVANTLHNLHMEGADNADRAGDGGVVSQLVDKLQNLGITGTGSPSAPSIDVGGGGDTVDADADIDVDADSDECHIPDNNPTNSGPVAGGADSADGADGADYVPPTWMPGPVRVLCPVCDARLTAQVNDKDAHTGRHAWGATCSNTATCTRVLGEGLVYGCTACKKAVCTVCVGDKINNDDSIRGARDAHLGAQYDALNGRNQIANALNLARGRLQAQTEKVTASDVLQMLGKGPSKNTARDSGGPDLGGKVTIGGKVAVQIRAPIRLGSNVRLHLSVEDPTYMKWEKDGKNRRMYDPNRRLQHWSSNLYKVVRIWFVPPRITPMPPGMHRLLQVSDKQLDVGSYTYTIRRIRRLHGDTAYKWDISNPPDGIYDREGGGRKHGNHVHLTKGLYQLTPAQWRAYTTDTCEDVVREYRATKASNVSNAQVERLKTHCALEVLGANWLDPERYNCAWRWDSSQLKGRQKRGHLQVVGDQVHVANPLEVGEGTPQRQETKEANTGPFYRQLIGC